MASTLGLTAVAALAFMPLDRVPIEVSACAERRARCGVLLL
jgi:hypothetical protein